MFQGEAFQANLKLFDRFAGSRVFVELKVPREGRKRYTGRLASVSDVGIELEVDRQPVSVSFDEIEKARLAPEAPGPSGGKKR